MGRLLLLLILLSAHALAQDAQPYDEERRLFQEAQRALETGDLERFRALAEGLEDYPLYPYLRYAEMRRYLSRQKPETVADFLATYADTPLAARLRGAWLRHLARQERWAEYLQFYEGTRSRELECHALNARRVTQGLEKVLGEAQGMWLSGRSMPEACDPVFDQLYAGEHIDETLRWQRVELAMESGSLRLARYLGRQLGPRGQAKLKLWRTVYHDPARGLADEGLRADTPINRRIVVHGMKRLALFDPEAARQSWAEIKARYDFDAETVTDIERRIALRAAYRHLPVAGDWLAELGEQAINPRVRQWRLKLALRAQRWPQVLQELERLPAVEREREKWRYWRARTLEALGRESEARPLYAELAGETGYYGFLAADRLQRPYRFRNTPVSLHTAFEDAEALLQRPAVLRARELLAVGEIIAARREWRDVLAELDAQELQAAALLAASWQWHDRAIVTLARAEYWDDLELRFPMPYRQEIEHEARRNGIDPAWIYAIMRRESAFMSDVRSPAGAIGLMQLMPATARQVARSQGLSKPDRYQLTDAHLNLRLGSAYLAQLAARFDDSRLFATAGYNAGPSRVSEWWPQAGHLPADIWVDTIPFTETRRYVRAVLAYRAIFQWKLSARAERLTSIMPALKAEDAPS